MKIYPVLNVLIWIRLSSKINNNSMVVFEKDSVKIKSFTQCFMDLMLMTRLRDNMQMKKARRKYRFAKANVWFSHPKCSCFERDWNDCKTLQSVISSLSQFSSHNNEPLNSHRENHDFWMKACLIELSWRFHRCQQQSSRFRRACIA